MADTAKSPLAVQLKRELAVWADNHINITMLLDRVNNVTNTNEALRKDLSSLRSRLLVTLICIAFAFHLHSPIHGSFTCIDIQILIISVDSIKR